MINLFMETKKCEIKKMPHEKPEIRNTQYGTLHRPKTIKRGMLTGVLK